jgi:hypothetical protein
MEFGGKTTNPSDQGFAEFKGIHENAEVENRIQSGPVLHSRKIIDQFSVF